MPSSQLCLLHAPASILDLGGGPFPRLCLQKPTVTVGTRNESPEVAAGWLLLEASDPHACVQGSSQVHHLREDFSGCPVQGCPILDNQFLPHDLFLSPIWQSAPETVLFFAFLSLFPTILPTRQLQRTGTYLAMLLTTLSLASKQQLT